MAFLLNYVGRTDENACANRGRIYAVLGPNRKTRRVPEPPLPSRISAPKSDVSADGMIPCARNSSIMLGQYCCTTMHELRGKDWGYLSTNAPLKSPSRPSSSACMPIGFSRYNHRKKQSQLPCETLN
ncbi:uncharacterized protein [Physcomitrium patens]|uniref:Uncharacterized protein n=1 Tax=Physcomitrium patens TaxID=3218 RepID=A9SYY7_PHYPA|nr:uncharacterized protein LOC112282193 [Physcomitrium patens]PNR62053.1 hypothetical protein PHYPA_000477 [Physcomitrium patens]|eukprot:XP_024375321.1 uncharacterized protein LOC112282193 [Physcomitrella patens]